MFVHLVDEDIHVQEDDGYAIVCLRITEVKDELLRAVVIYVFTQDESAIRKIATELGGGGRREEEKSSGEGGGDGERRCKEQREEDIGTRGEGRGRGERGREKGEEEKEGEERREEREGGGMCALWRVDFKNRS